MQLLGGTFFFIFFGLALGALGLYLLRSKRLDRDNAQIYCTTIVSVCFACEICVRFAERVCSGVRRGRGYCGAQRRRGVWMCPSL